ncbi:MAG: hypothetical protein ACE5F9_09380 [Phycisphaerae bacterium]
MQLQPRFVVDAQGQRTGVLISIEEYERLLVALEDQLDAADLDAAVATERDFVPYENVRTELRDEGKV